MVNETSEDLRIELNAHPLHRALCDADAVRCFMEHHVVCVLDFMSLLKRLQRELTCVDLPWTPVEDPTLARFVNEIVADEESDPAFGAEPRSHYAWYVAAMEEIGADSGPIRRVEDALRRGAPPAEALAGKGLPEAAEGFARSTFEIAEGPLAGVAGAFFHGREELLPRLFRPLAHELRATGVPCELLVRYLERHVEVDGEDHGPLAERLLGRVCGSSPEAAGQAERAAHRSLIARRDLWNSVLAAISPRTAAASGV